MAKSRGRKFAEITSPASGVFDLTSVPTITNAKLQNSAMTLAGSSVSLGGTGVADTDALSEGSSNVYFTDARVQTFLGGGTLAGNIVVPDNRSIYLGSSSDFRMVHNTTNTQLINATGQLQITSNGGFAVTGAATFSSTITSTGHAATGDIVVTKSSAKVEVTESSGASVRMIAGGATGYIGNYSNHSLQILTNSTPAITIDNAQNATFAGNVRVSGNLGIGANASSVIGVYSTKSLANGLAAEFTNSESSTGSGIVVRGGNNASTYSADFRDYNSNSLMRVRGDGNVGIGQGAPGYKLEVNGTAHVVNTLTAGAVGIPSQGITLNQGFGTGVPTMTMLGTAANGRAGAILFQEQGASNTAAIYSTDGGTGNASYGGLTIATYQSDLRFATNGLASTRMLIDSSGNVGIGSTPTAILDVRRGDASGKIAEFHNNSGYGIDIGSSQTVAYISSGYNQRLDFKTDPTSGQTERMSILANGNVGIGETSPLGKLHVRTADSGATVDVSADELVVEGSGNAGISILSGQSYSGNIYFGDAGVNWDGYIAYSQAARQMNLGAAAGSTVLKIDSDGIYTGSYGSGSTNTVYGLGAYYSNQSGGIRNVVIGHNTWYYGTTGDENVIIGTFAAGDNTANHQALTGGVYIGQEAGHINVGNFTTAIGYQAGYKNYGGSSVFIGYRSGGYSNTGSSGDNNVAVGMRALYDVTSGVSNACLGYHSLKGITTGSYNVAIGYQAADNLTTGHTNVAIGKDAMSNTGTAHAYNVAIGGEALMETSQSSQTAVGFRALRLATTGQHNTAVGYESMEKIVTGDQSSCFGKYAGKEITSGGNNTLIGHEAGKSINTGGGNNCLGKDAGDTITDGIRNICIGQNANPNQSNGEYQIILGHDISGPGDNHAMIGRGGQGYWKLSHTANTGWVFVSDERIKKNIQNDTLGLEFINKIRPVTYNHKKNEEIDADFLDSTVNWKRADADDTVLHRGLVAQEVKTAMNEVGNTNFDGWSQDDDGMQGVSKEAFITPLINAVKELSAEVTALKAEVKALKGE